MKRFSGILGWCVASVAIALFWVSWTGVDLSTSKVQREQLAAVNLLKNQIDEAAAGNGTLVAAEFEAPLKAAVAFAESMVSRIQPEEQKVEPLKTVLLVVERLKTGNPEKISEAVNLLSRSDNTISPSDLSRFRESVEAGMAGFKSRLQTEWSSAVTKLVADSISAASEDPLNEEKLVRLAQQASDLEQRSNQFRGNYQKERQSLEACRSAITDLVSYKRYSDQGLKANAASTLHARLSSYSRPDSVKIISEERARTLIDSVIGQTEELKKEEQLARWSEQVDDFFDNVYALSEASDAITRRDLDGLRLLGSSLEINQPEGRSEALRAACEKLETSSKGLYTWRRFVELRDKGYEEKARDAIKSLDPTKTNGLALISESNLTMLSEGQTIPTYGWDGLIGILQKVEELTTESIAGTIDEIQEIPWEKNDIAEDSLKNLNRLRLASLERDTNASATRTLRNIISFAKSGNRDVDKELMRIRKAFTFSELERYFVSKGRAAPDPESSAIQYVYKNVQTSQSTPDLSTKELFEDLRVYDATLDIYGVSQPDWLESDLSSLSSYLRAEKYESNGDLSMALKYYRLVTRISNSKLTLDTEIKSKIDMIREKSPALLESDNQAVIDRLDAIYQRVNRPVPVRSTPPTYIRR